MVTSPINAALAAVCVSLAIALTAVLISPPREVAAQSYAQSTAAKNQNDTGQATPGDPNAENSRQQRKHEPRWYDIFERPAEGWIALFNGLLVVATIFLWKAGERQIAVARDAADAAAHSAEIAERALVMTNRAFVFVKRVCATALPEEGPVNSWNIRIVWKNSGSTPTQNLVIYRNYDVFDGPLPDDFNFPDHVKRGQPKDTPRTFIGPSGTKEAVGPPFQITVLRELRDGSKQLYLWGWAEYHDVFTQLHRSEFCFEVMVKGDLNHRAGANTRGPFDFVVYKKHNGSEAECFHRAGETIPIYETD